MAHQHVRLVDIASRAGVSISAVSKALQDKSEIAPETKERIMAIAKEMGYQPNTMARSLRLGRSDLIGVIIPDNTNPYYSYILKGIEEKAKENGFTIIITNTMEDAETERQSIHTIVGSSVAGILAVPVNLKNYKDLSTPVLFLSRFPYREYSGYNKNNIPVWEQQSYILSDDFEGQRIATEHLIDKGLRDIYLCLDTNSLDTVRGVKTRIRLEGYRNALEIAGIPYDKNKVLFNINSTENGYNCAKKLCSEVAMPFGLCLTNDRTAMGAHRAFKEMGVLVPEDVKMVGYDDIELAAYLTPALTTVHSAKYSMGVQGATQLIDLINGRYKGQQRTHIILGPYLVCRETT